MGMVLAEGGRGRVGGEGRLYLVGLSPEGD